MADNPTPLIDTMQRISRSAAKAGYPRSENGQEMMTQDAKDRATGQGRSKQNDLLHGRKARKGATVG